MSLVILPEAVRTATCRNNGSVHHSEGAGVYVRLIFGVALLILVTAVSEVSAESIQYEIVALHWWGNELIAKGTYEYTVRDVRVTELATGDAHVWQKSVKIWGEYAIGASVYREASLDGFGLWVQKGQHGFSWDWFDRESKDVYRKLQGPGRVRVRFTAAPNSEEIAAVEFLEDVTLRGMFSWWPFSDSHHVLVRKGSVLRVAP